MRSCLRLCTACQLNHGMPLLNNTYSCTHAQPHAHRHARVIACACQLTRMMQAINNTHSRTHAQPCGHTLTHAYCLDVPMDTHLSSNQEHPLTHACAAACAHACVNVYACQLTRRMQLLNNTHSCTHAQPHVHTWTHAPLPVRAI
jgi:hypothetical protein